MSLFQGSRTVAQNGETLFAIFNVRPFYFSMEFGNRARHELGSFSLRPSATALGFGIAGVALLKLFALISALPSLLA